MPEEITFHIDVPFKEVPAETALQKGTRTHKHLFGMTAITALLAGTGERGRIDYSREPITKREAKVIAARRAKHKRERDSVKLNRRYLKRGRPCQTSTQ